MVFLTLGIRVITPGFKRNNRKSLGDEILSVCDRDTNIWATWQQLSCHSHHCTASRETTQSELATRCVVTCQPVVNVGCASEHRGSWRTMFSGAQTSIHQGVGRRMGLGAHP